MAHIKPSKLFVGLEATFTRETPGFAIYFSNYEYWKRRFYSDTPMPPHASFLIGGSSGLVAWIFIYPQDQIKTILQSRDVTAKETSFMSVAKQIKANGGLRAFYSGFHFALMRAVPLHAGTFMAMEYCQQNFLAPAIELPAAPYLDLNETEK